MIEVQFTSGSLDEARLICRYLVEKRLVACAQIIPWIESLYMWDNNLDVAQESKVLLKTTEENLPEVEKMILANHSYEVPEIVWRKIDGATEKYAEWLSESTAAAQAQ